MIEQLVPYSKGYANSAFEYEEWMRRWRSWSTAAPLQLYGNRSAATILPCLLSERGFRGRRLCRLRLSSVAGLVPMFLFLPEPRLAAKCRPAVAVRLAALLRSCRFTRIVVSTSTVLGVAGF